MERAHRQHSQGENEAIVHLSEKKSCRRRGKQSEWAAASQRTPFTVRVMQTLNIDPTEITKDLGEGRVSRLKADAGGGGEGKRAKSSLSVDRSQGTESEMESAKRYSASRLFRDL